VVEKLTSIPTIYDSDIYYDDDKDKTELFNDFFARQCELNDEYKPTPLTYPNENVRLIPNSIVITVQDVKDTLLTLKINKAVGPDFIHPRILT